MQAGLTGPRFGCEEGACGACTVEMNGATVKSCLVLAAQADGARVVAYTGSQCTVEMYAGTTKLEPATTTARW